MTFCVRIASQPDISHVSDLCIKLAVYEARLVNQHVDEEEIRKRVSQEILFDIHSAYFVAEMNGRIVGVVKVCEKENWLARISEAYVEVAHRNKGIMTALFKKALEWARSRGMKGLYLTVVKGNYEAYNFWKSIGFEFERYVGEHLIKMSKAIDSLAS